MTTTQEEVNAVQDALGVGMLAEGSGTQTPLLSDGGKFRFDKSFMIYIYICG
jgi:hypothetical protein